MALDANNLPKTLARITPSIVIKAAKAGDTVKDIGAVISMRRNVSRTTSRRFELDSEVPGRAAEIIPGAVKTVSLTIGVALLYKGSLLEVLGFTDAEDLAKQNIPIDIVEIRHGQPHSANSAKTQTITYSGCYFTSNPLSINIDDNWQIIQDFELEVAKITTLDGPTE